MMRRRKGNGQVPFPFAGAAWKRYLTVSPQEAKLRLPTSGRSGNWLNLK